jgi:hypothetical protein
MGTIVAGTTRAIGGITSIIKSTGEGLNGALSLLAWPFALIGNTAGLVSDSLAGGFHENQPEVKAAEQAPEQAPEQPEQAPVPVVEAPAQAIQLVAGSRTRKRISKSKTRSKKRRTMKKSKSRSKRSLRRKQ